MPVFSLGKRGISQDCLRTAILSTIVAAILAGEVKSSSTPGFRKFSYTLREVES